MRIVLFLLLLVLPPQGMTSSSQFEKLRADLESLQKTSGDLDDNQKEMAFSNAFNANLQLDKLSKTQLARLPSKELSALFFAADLATFYSPTAEHVRVMELAFLELKRRDMADKQQYEYMYGAYIQTQMFIEAKTLRSTSDYPLPVLPELKLEDVHLPQAWRVDDSGTKLTLYHLDVISGPTILVVTHPKCNFSQKAFTAILQDAALSPIFSKYAKLVIPSSRTMDVDAVRDWNAHHRNLPMSLAFSKNQWPSSMSWETPTFYFYVNGKMIRKVQGWPKGGNLPALLDAASEAGLVQ